MWLFLSLILGDHLCIILGKRKRKEKKKDSDQKKKASKIKSGLLLQLLKVVYYCKSQEL